ncbi:MAG: hypothetical protein U0518_01245 [Candidatus Gracilibacteria bacterium]
MSNNTHTKINRLRALLNDGDIKQYQLNSILMDIVRITSCEEFNVSIQTKVIDKIQILLSGDYYIYELAACVSDLNILLENILEINIAAENSFSDQWDDEGYFENERRCKHSEYGFSCMELFPDEDDWCSACRN